MDYSRQLKVQQTNDAQAITTAAQQEQNAAAGLQTVDSEMQTLGNLAKGTFRA